MDLAVPCLDDINCPKPCHIRRSDCTEEGYDMTPRGNEDSWSRVSVSPRKPDTVHLVAKSQDNWLAIPSDGLSIGGQIGVILARCDCGKSYVSRIYLHQWHRPVLGGGCREASLEWLPPSAVVDNQSRPDPCGPCERCYSRVREWCLLRIDPEVRPRGSWETSGCTSMW